MTCRLQLEDGSGCLLLEDGSGYLLLEFCNDNPLSPNGNRRQEYQPRYHEIQAQRAIERKFEEAQLDLKSTEIKIEELELKRLRDLADQAMQLEIRQLLEKQNELMLLIEMLQQQKLRILLDDNEVMFLMGYLN